MSIESYTSRVALVTGASRGLGAHIARELAAAGCHVAVTARSAEPLDTLAREIEAETGRTAIAVPGDVCSDVDRAGIVEQASAVLGPIDILANVAAIAKATAFADEDPARPLATNLEAPMQLTRLVVPGMIDRGYGRVLNIASLAGLAGLPHLVGYSTAKAGLIAFSTALRAELRGTGVSSTVVSPGFIGDEGMYPAYGTPVPWYLGTNASAAVARKAVRALRRDRSEVIVNRIPLRALVVLGSMSDRTMRAMTRALGADDYLRELADQRLPYSDLVALPR